MSMAARSRSRTPARCSSARSGRPSSISCGTNLAVAPGALVGAGGRPMALKRFVNGAAGEAFFQKRAPDNRPEWLRTVTLSFPSGRNRRRDRRRRRGGPRLDRQPRLPRPEPAPGSGGRPGSSRRAARRPRPRARHRMGPDPRCRDGDEGIARSGSASSAGRRHPGRGGSTSTSGSSGAGPIPRSGAPRWQSPATSSGGRPQIATAEGGEGDVNRVLADGEVSVLVPVAGAAGIGV